MKSIIDTFVTEARENLARLESALLELEASPDDNELINTAFRAMHTIKGAGGMFGYNDLTRFTHHFESALDFIRNGKIAINQDIIGIFLEARDFIETLLDNTEFDSNQKMLSQQILERLFSLVSFNEGPSEFVDNENEINNLFNQNENIIYRIRFKPDLDTYQNGFDVTPILRELSSYGECSVITHTSDLPDFTDLEPEKNYLRWDVMLITTQSQSIIEDSFIFVAEDWQISIDIVDSNSDDNVPDRLGDLLVARGLITEAQLEQELGAKQKIGELLTSNGLVDSSDINAALEEQKMMRKAKNNKPEPSDSTVRVPAFKLDKLMNLVGELVIVQARLKQISSSLFNESVNSISEELDHLTTQMRDETFSIRMLPIGSTFSRFRRLVRDLAKDLGKKIQLETFGAETELDKMVIDKLADPLVHLIRNSIDHGIEDENIRKSAGKSPTGTITLSAEHSNAYVIIKIRDDGQGLNTQKIRQLAIEKKLISSEEDYSDEFIHLLIFEPGFSTAKQVSDISGRGVGMDVVKRSIHDLGGTITIHSEPGQETEFTVRLPMTLAIIEGLMVSVGEDHYVLPLSSVEECIEMPDPDLIQRSRKRLVNVRGEQVPFLYLREWFEIPGKRPAIEQIVVTHIGEDRFGFCVDEVIGQYQTVVKRLGKIYENTSGFSGATILGDGNVAVILDPQALMEAAGAHNQQKFNVM